MKDIGKAMLTTITLVGATVLSLFVIGLVIIQQIIGVVKAGITRAFGPKKTTPEYEAEKDQMVALYEAVLQRSFELFGDHEAFGSEVPLRKMHDLVNRDIIGFPKDIRGYARLLVLLCDAMVRSRSGIEFEDIDLGAYNLALKTFIASRESGLNDIDLLKGHIEIAFNNLHGGIDNSRRVAGIALAISVLALSQGGYSIGEVIVEAFNRIDDLSEIYAEDNLNAEVAA